MKQYTQLNDKSLWYATLSRILSAAVQEKNKSVVIQQLLEVRARQLAYATSHHRKLTELTISLGAIFVEPQIAGLQVVIEGSPQASRAIGQ